MTPRVSIGAPLTIASLERSVVRVLFAIAAFFAIAHFSMVGLLAALGPERLHRLSLLYIFDQFNLDKENNLPTFFSCAILAIAGGLLLLIARRVRETRGPMLLQWRILGALFLAMSFDEFAGIHEKFGEILKERFHAPVHGAMHFTWVVVGLPFVAIVGSLYLPFLLALPRRLRNAMFLSGLIYVSGALGMELVDGWYSDRYGETTIYLLMTGLEEVLEMTGVILFIGCLLQRLGQDAGEVRLFLREPAREAVAGAGRTEKKPTDESLRPWASTR